ncbi:hypothetical protein IWW48_001103 [Coemansia sp. RSA 1200]|nr:hypothetical protein IWW48_001103 [Coemansia sp. RSA 1200]
MTSAGEKTSAAPLASEPSAAPNANGTGNGNERRKEEEETNSTLGQLLLGGNVGEIQGLLKSLADKADDAEKNRNNNSSAGREAESVADAYGDIVRAEGAVGSLESRLDSLLGRLDGLLEMQQEAGGQK